MNPWDLVGWVVLAWLIFEGVKRALPLYGRARRAIRDYIRYLKTRSIPPAPGQEWMQGGSPLYIDRIVESGNLVVKTSRYGLSGASWGESPENWAKRVRNRRLYLVRHD